PPPESAVGLAMRKLTTKPSSSWSLSTPTAMIKASSSISRAFQQPLKSAASSPSSAACAILFPCRLESTAYPPPDKMEDEEQQGQQHFNADGNDHPRTVDQPDQLGQVAREGVGGREGQAGERQHVPAVRWSRRQMSQRERRDIEEGAGLDQDRRQPKRKERDFDALKKDAEVDRPCEVKGWDRKLCAFVADKDALDKDKQQEKLQPSAADPDHPHFHALWNPRLDGVFVRRLKGDLGQQKRDQG